MPDTQKLIDSLFAAMLEGVASHQIVRDDSGRASDYRIVSVNPALATLLEQAQQALVGELASEVYGKLGISLLEELAEVAESGSAKRFETYFEPLDKHLVISAFPYEHDHLICVFADTSAKQKEVETLKRTQEELVEAQRISHTGSWHLDLGSNQQIWSEALYTMLRLDPSKAPPEYPEAEKLFTEESWALLSSSIANTAETGHPYEIELEMIRADASRGWMLGRGEAVKDESGNIVALRGIAIDITARKNAELQLMNEKAFVDKLINLQTDTFFLHDPATGKPLLWNRSLTCASGYSDEEIASMKAPQDFFDEDDLKKAEQTINETFAEGQSGVELNLITKSGERIPFEYRVQSIEDNSGTTLFLSLGRDITERKRVEAQFRSHEEELKRIAHYDTLTSIPNRLLLSDRMNQALALAAREHSMLAVCYIDLDGFKPINDVFGHDAGDQVLIEIANRIKKIIRGTDTVARIGGDEFAVLLQGINKIEECKTTLERMLHSVAQPVKVQGKICKVSASIGVSIYPIEDENADTLLRHADHAMYVAKQSGKNRFYINDPAQEQQARDRHEFLESVALGLKQNQFQLYYQPKINLKTKKLVGAEALIRWLHPDKGLISPAEFLPKIENTRLDVEIGEWVIATALAQLSYWREQGLDIEISVNISGYHLESESFVSALKKQLSAYPKLPAASFQIEVLETVALSDVNTVREVIEAGQSMGVGFALDDFGTGYSSLTYLSRLPIDVLKIDQSFIRDMLEDEGDMSIVQGIVALAKTFNRKIVAEGIETEQHYQELLKLDCEMGQGYYIARPMPASELLTWRASI